MGRCHEVRIDYVNSVANDLDYILMLNDDVEIAPNFVSNLYNRDLCFKRHAYSGSQASEPIDGGRP